MTNKMKNVPELRFPEFIEEWEEKRLGEVTIYKNGGSFENSVKNHGIFKLITLKSVNTEGEFICVYFILFSVFFVYVSYIYN